MPPRRLRQSMHARPRSEIVEVALGLGRPVVSAEGYKRYRYRVCRTVARTDFRCVQINLSLDYAIRRPPDKHDEN